MKQIFSSFGTLTEIQYTPEIISVSAGDGPLSNVYCNALFGGLCEILEDNGIENPYNTVRDCGFICSGAYNLNDCEELENGEQLHGFEITANGTIIAVTVSPDGNDIYRHWALYLNA